MSRSIKEATSWREGARNWLAYFGLISLPVVGLGAAGSVDPMTFQNDNGYVKIEILDDHLIHVETSFGKVVDASVPIWRSPMIMNQTWPGAESLTVNGNRLETNRLVVDINQQSLCVNAFDKVKQVKLASMCPYDLPQPWKGLSLLNPETKHMYGLGQYFTNPGTADGDWIGRQWDPLSWTEGNALRGFSGGANGYANFPIMYGLRDGKEGQFGLLVDNVYKKFFKFDTHPHSLEMYGDSVRYFFFAGDDLPDLTKTFKGLAGKPPMPPKSAFGVWVSEFGFESWWEAENAVNSMHSENFPIDGLGMDIQWFGGTFFERGADTRGSRMGTLDWDPNGFPDPVENVAKFKNERGVELMLIEESYISKFLPEHQALQEQKYMATYCGNEWAPIYLDSNPWWGVGGMLDWTNPGTGSYWHKTKRSPLVELGINHHWTDLGEPEMFSRDACYYGFPELGKHRHSDIHNVYNLKWIESIADGYAETHPDLRYFSMSRSGTIGLHRHGGGMWSGDIGANMGALTAHLNTQMHMSLSGMDYYGGDIGGFHRRPDTLDGDQNQLFSQWLANSALFDFPVRSHTWNLANNLETAPSKIGDGRSNLFNIYLRYQLTPYYYSLARTAYEDGTPIVPPLVYYYQEDQNVWGMGNQKMIGPNLMAAVVAGYGQVARGVYLPKGEWFDFHTNDYYESNGEKISAASSFTDSRFRLPLFAKASSIIPLMDGVEKVRNLKEETWDGSERERVFRFRVFGSETESFFEYYEDDGISNGYQTNKYRKTKITQKLVKNPEGGTLAVRIDPSKGAYTAKRADSIRVEAVVGNMNVNGAKWNGAPLSKCTASKTSSCFTDAESSVNGIATAYLDAKAGTDVEVIEFEVAPKAPSKKLMFVCDEGYTVQGQAMYVVGNQPELGNWDAKKAVKLDPTWYPRWSGVVEGFQDGDNVEWKCIRGSEASSENAEFSSVANKKLKVGGKHNFSGTSYSKF